MCGQSNRFVHIITLFVNLFPEPVSKVHDRLFIVFVQECRENKYETPVNAVQCPGRAGTAGREVNEKHFRDDGKIQQVHRVGNQADMGEESDQYFRPFFDTFEFRQEKKATKTLDKDPEDFCEKKIRRPVNVNNDITNYYPDNETDVS